MSGFIGWAGRPYVPALAKVTGAAGPARCRASTSAKAERQMFAVQTNSTPSGLASPSPVLMDRGIPDVVGYLTLCGLPVPAHIEAAAKIHPYNERVFLAPYWGAIFAQDAERKQDRQEAEATGRVMAETYTRLGYQIVELPLVGIEQRADFIAERLQAG